MRMISGCLLLTTLVACGGSGGSGNPGSNGTPDAGGASEPVSETNQANFVTRCGVDVDLSTLDITSESATYCATFTALWTEGEFLVVPSSAHFTTLIGAAVNNDSSLWARGALASPGLESVAELGLTGDFTDEINVEINENRALSVFTLDGTGATGTNSGQIAFNRSFPLVTFASMVAPSPDWFVGLSEYPLLNTSGEWIEDTGNIELLVYDAGTETGNTYSLDGVATDPPEAIHRLSETVNDQVVFEDGTANGNAIAVIRFERMM